MLGKNSQQILEEIRKKNNILNKNFIDFSEYNINFFYKIFYCFPQLQSLSLRFEYKQINNYYIKCLFKRLTTMKYTRIRFPKYCQTRF